MGCRPKGKCSTTPANAPQQSKLSSFKFFAPAVAQLFERPRNSLRAGASGSAAGGAGSASGSGAA
eukprot:2665919-Rhodomonas_salina.1